MRAIVVLILLLTSIGQISIAGLASSILSSGQHPSHQLSFTSSDQDNTGYHFSTYHEGSDPMIIEELFEEDTEETETETEKGQSINTLNTCSRCEQITLLQEAYNVRRYLPSQKYSTSSTRPIWLKNEVFRL